MRDGSDREPLGGRTLKVVSAFRPAHRVARTPVRTASSSSSSRSVVPVDADRCRPTAAAMPCYQEVAGSVVSNVVSIAADPLQTRPLRHFWRRRAVTATWSSPCGV